MDSPAQWVPKVVDGAEITKLPIDPMEGFVLSRIDGRVTVGDISDLTGFESVQVVATIEKLVALGAASWAVGGPPQAAAPRRPAPRATRHEAGDETGSRHRSAAPPPPGAKGGLYDPRELEEEVELAMDRRRQVLDTFYRLDDLSHYELLGIAEDAEKKDIRHAYFLLSKVFHPDTLFGKKLGSYKAKMEKVFRQLTEAYEVLGKKKNRAEYDEYLAIRKLTRAAQRTLDEGQQVAREIERVRESQLPPATMDVGVERQAPPPEPEAPRAPRPSPAPPSAEEAAARRRRAQDFAARRLASTVRPGATASQIPRERPPSSSPAPAAPKVDRDQILRGLTSSLRGAAAHTGGVDQAMRHVRIAQEHEKAGRLAEAASALRLAMALAPDNAPVEAEYRRVDQILAASMADTYQKQAEYEERNEKWAAAALSWGRVADGRPGDPEPRRHAARCLLQGQGDLRRAKSLAQSVVDAFPTDVEARILLARIYKAAGMAANAKREAEAAAKLDPANDFVNNLLRELK